MPERAGLEASLSHSRGNGQPQSKGNRIAAGSGLPLVRWFGGKSRAAADMSWLLADLFGNIYYKKKVSSYFSNTSNIAATKLNYGA
jgi:hypothetical protein